MVPTWIRVCLDIFSLFVYLFVSLLILTQPGPGPGRSPQPSYMPLTESNLDLNVQFLIGAHFVPLVRRLTLYPLVKPAGGTFSLLTGL